MLTIKIVGSGCKNCENLYQLCMNVAAENNLDADIQKITDTEKFAELGVWMTPALMVNGQILSQGKIPTKSTLLHWLEKQLTI
jgi:small redox-active disulfide protein 2